jgi:hypothetical protein
MPYNLKMKDLSREARKKWRLEVRRALPSGEFLILAGKDYVDALELPNARVICKGMNLFERMFWLRKHPIYDSNYQEN